jgi:microcystin-dependent protein
MSQQFVGQITLGAWNFAPRGGAFCQGQLLAIDQNNALFALLGTTYGGDGQVTFALPDLQGRLAVGQGQGPGLSNYVLGQEGGVENVTLTAGQLPLHTHPGTFTSTSTLNAATVKGTDATPQASPQSMLARSVDGATPIAAQPRVYAPASSTPVVPLAGLNVAGTVVTGNTGGSQPHTNMQPYLALNYVMALEGIFPSRN